MTAMRRIVTMLLAGAMLPWAAADAANSRQVLPFQGAVAVKPGQPPLDGNPYPARFEIYDAATGGTKLFEDINSVTVVNGAFSTELGAGATPLNSSVITDHPDLWLQVALDLNRSGTFENDEVVQPRTHLGSAPLAMYAPQAGTAAKAGETSLIRVPAELRDGTGAWQGTFGGNGSFSMAQNLADTATPAVGTIYRNNVLLAWGLIGSDGSLVRGFGIKGVTLNDTDFGYEITLANPVVLQSAGGVQNPSYSVQVTSLDDSLRPELMIYEPRSSTQIGVYVFGLDGAVAFNDGSISIPRVRSAFSVAVFGLQQ